MKLEGMLKVYCHDVEANKPGDTEFIQFTVMDSGPEHTLTCIQS